LSSARSARSRCRCCASTAWLGCLLSCWQESPSRASRANVRYERSGMGGNQQQRVVVIGGGIIGACCAYGLGWAGFDVLMIEKDEPGRAASYGNSGSIGLSSSPPLGVPGMLKDVPRMLLDPEHALVIRWRHLPRALPWFLKFARTLAPERVEAIA